MNVRAKDRPGLLTIRSFGRGPVRGRRSLSAKGWSRLQAASDSGELVDLLARCAVGDRAAFEAIYRRQSARLYGVALRITRQASLAADAVHDTFVQVWQNAGRFDADRGSVEAWLMGLVRYRALDIARRRSREVPGAEGMDRPDEAPDALAQLMSSQQGAALARCLAELEPDRRRIVIRAFTDGLSHTELAAELAQPLGTVKSWIRRALANLRRCLTV